MISICIPIYNFDISQLLEEISRQSKQIDAPSEIILIDDCSSEAYKKLNEISCKKQTYIELDKNVGRAEIRNLFLRYANFEHLLFLDCDSIIISKDFLSNYVESIRQRNSDVVCGGRIYDDEKPERNKMLRWKYGKRRESQPIELRETIPNKSFMTNNFLISRKTLEEVKFDQRITEYGHEDTLFGFELKKKGILIEHIENPVLNGDVEDNADFLAKTEKGVVNLINILNNTDHDLDFINDVTILSTYEKLKSKGLTPLVYLVFIVLKPLLQFLFVRGYVNLRLFDFYKLGKLIQGFKNYKT
jgi:GT2 family glycosyltransferase